MVRQRDEEIRMMIISVNEALKFIKKNPNCSDEEAIAHMISTIKAKEKIKMIGLAATSFALGYRQRKNRAKDKEIFQFILDKSNEIINSVDSEIKNEH